METSWGEGGSPTVGKNCGPFTRLDSRHTLVAYSPLSKRIGENHRWQLKFKKKIEVSSC